MRTPALVLTLLCAACGFDVVDFEPRTSEVAVEQVVIGTVPQEAIDRLSAGGKSKREPKLSLVAPRRDVVLPANVAPLSFRWSELKPGKPEGPTAGVVYELSLRTAGRELQIYTLELSALAPAERWFALLREPGAEPMTAQLRALATGPKDALLEGEPQTLHIVAALPAGSLYFESTAGLERVRVGELVGEAFSAPMTTCRTGHAISRDGSKLGVACAEGPGALCSLPSLSLLQTLAAEPGSTSFGAFAPDGARYVRARDGQLEIAELGSGVVQKLAPIAVAAGALMDEPDWSADGQAIVFRYWPASPATKPGAPGGASIARVLRTADWGEPQIMASGSAPTSTLGAPRYTPDGSYLVYEETGGELSASGLRLLPAEGGAPVAVGPMMMTMMKPEPKSAGMFPSWLPSQRAGHAWLLFSSSADDGAPAPALTQRLWLRDVDLARLPAADALAPAFALPLQPTGAAPRRARFAPEPALP